MSRSRARKPSKNERASHLPDKKNLLEAMAREGLPPASLREILRRLGVNKAHRNAFKRLVRDLVESGEIVRVGKNEYALSRRPGSASVSGRVQRHPDGYGFLVPDSGPEDFYLHPRTLESVFHGDRVQARVVRRAGKGRAEATITRLLEPARRRVMGIYRAGPAEPHVEAYDRSYASGIVVNNGSLVPLEGQVVGVQLTDPPSSKHPARGRVVEILGYPDEPGMDVRTVARKYDLREAFPEEALREAAAHPNPAPPEELARREDFRALPIVTIDGETAMDFDDAVQVERLPGGLYRLGVHIADVSHYVREETALDHEAQRRGTSVYFPGTAIPMLPASLSSDLCSLLPEADRLTLSVLMDIDSQGRTFSVRFAEGVIRSRRRMTYTEVARVLEQKDEETMRRCAPLVEEFRLMQELCGVLHARRRRRGTIDFDLPEPEILLDIQGATLGIVPMQRNIAHRIIEEFMLAANEAVAEYLFTNRVPSLYRIHERPDPLKIERLNELLHAFGVGLPEPYEALKPVHFQEVLDLLEGRPELRFASRSMLRAMKLARYSAEKGLHFGLGTSTYTHFTSPIRRYPDLMVHRILREQLADCMTEERKDALRARLPEVANQSSRTERTADEAESEVVEWKKLSYLADRVGDTFDGIIASITPFGFFVEITDLFVEGLVHISTLPRDRYAFVERKQILKGERTGTTYRIGAPFRVRLDRVQAFQRRVDFSPADANPAHRQERP